MMKAVTLTRTRTHSHFPPSYVCDCWRSLRLEFSCCR
jgi:hypothetical protein